MKNTSKTSRKTGAKPENDTPLPFPLTYDDIEPIVEYLAKVKSRDNTFDCWDVEDIAQEIRIICMYALSEYEPSKAQTYKQAVNYFGRCVDNRLNNLKRDNYIRFNPPLSKEEIRLVNEEPESFPVKKEKLDKFYIGIEIQKKIKHPVDIDVVGDSSDLLRNDFEEEILARDMGRHIIDSIDENLRQPLIHLICGEKKKVNIRVRKKIQASVRTILDE